MPGMRDISLGAALRYALVAGLAAGLAAALFHLVVTEPVIDQAITLEEALSAGEGPHEEPIVSRDGQRIGLVVGFVLYGLTWGLLVAVVYHGTQRWLPASSAALNGLALALAGYWALALLPFLKYPANPPGVGDPETIAQRQTLYLVFLVCSVIGVAVALAVGKLTGLGPLGWFGTLGALAAFGAALYLAAPAHSDAIRLPMEIVADFRVRSLAGLSLFWAVLGLIFALLLRHPASGQRLGRPHTVPA